MKRKRVESRLKFLGVKSARKVKFSRHCPKYINSFANREKQKLLINLTRVLFQLHNKSLSIHQSLHGPGFHARENLKRKACVCIIVHPLTVSIRSRWSGVASDGRVQLTYSRVLRRLRWLRQLLRPTRPHFSLATPRSRP